MSGLFANVDLSDISGAARDTLLMLGGSLVLTILLGIPLGVLLFLTDARQIAANRLANRAIGVIVNILRSIPFIILLIVMIPLTVRVMGTSLGVAGAIPPLVVGATTWQIVIRALLPEAMPGLIAGATVTAVALVSFTAMAGVVGAGGLGDLAIRTPSSPDQGRAGDRGCQVALCELSRRQAR